MLHFVIDFTIAFQQSLYQSLQTLFGSFTDPFTGLMTLPLLLGCTRAVYRGLDGLVITGRTMDWLNDMKSNLWAFPRGIERDGAAGESSIRWTSKYGSVGVSGWDIGIADGMNEAGQAGIIPNLRWDRMNIGKWVNDDCITTSPPTVKPMAFRRI